MATESSLAPPALETRSKKRTDPPGRPSPNPTGPKRRQPGEVFHSPSSGPPTPDFGDEACSGPAEWEIGEDSGGLPYYLKFEYRCLAQFFRSREKKKKKFLVGFVVCKKLSVFHLFLHSFVCLNSFTYRKKKRERSIKTFLLKLK